MHKNTLFMVMTFIIIIVVVIISDTIMTAMIVASLVANFFVISSHMGEIASTDGIANFISAPTETSSQPENVEPIESVADIYGPKYSEYYNVHDSYTSAYPTPALPVIYSASERTNTVDGGLVQLAQHRARDKKVSDGWAVRDSDYYARHFAEELNEAENAPWWGRKDK